jgi:drug/metabolite transporter (DMT)-like permease
MGAMSWSLWLLNLLVPVAVIVVDYGRRKLSLMRIIRPFIITAVVVPFVAPGIDLHWNGLLLELAGIAAGVLLGIGTALLVRLDRDDTDNTVFTISGVAYVLAWAAFAAARIAFIWESSHSKSFGRALGSFLIDNHIGITALADAVMFLGFAMMVANRGTLWSRSRSARVGGSVPVAVTRTTTEV